MADKSTKEEEKKVTLAESDIQQESMERRSVLQAIGTGVLGAVSTVLGGCIATVPAGGTVYGPQPVVASGVTDSDGGPYADPAGRGRGPRRGQTGITDSDGGPYADPPGGGRGRPGLAVAQPVQPQTVVVQPAYGASGMTDSDGGSNADPAGNGRGPRRGYTGLTDGDGGATADPAGQGRGPHR